jgi:hypothetical protein
VLIRRLIHLSWRLTPTLLCVACVPLVVIFLVRWLFGMPLSAFRPVLSDEVYYWHEALTFARAGLQGGYYTLEEVTNPSGFTPFGPHGAGFVMLYGLVARFVEWHRHSVLLLNLVVIAAGAWVWASCARISTAKLWLSVLLLATFWQVVFWASTGMQETFHHAGALVMAALFARALAPGNVEGLSPTRQRLMATGAAILVLLSLVRPTWIILMPLWVLVTMRDSGRTRLMTAVAASVVVGIVMLLVFNRTVAPYSRGFSFVEMFNRSPGNPSLVENLMFNLNRTVTFSEYDDLEILHRLQYWGFMAATLVASVILWRKRATGPVAHLAVAATTMVAILGLMLLLYSLTNWAEHRVLSAFLLFAVLLTLAAPGRIPVLLVTALIVSNLATAATFRRVFEAKRQDQFVWDRRGVNALEEALTTHGVTYRKSDSRWCNTLLTAQEPPYLIAVPAGIGISVVRESDQMSVPPRSHYLLLDESALVHFTRPLRVQPLATLPYGTLYVNLESGCR